MNTTRAILIGFAIAVALTIALAAYASKRRTVMFRKQLPRIYELCDLLPTPPPADAYLADLDRTLVEMPGKLASYREVEQDLQSLDMAAWTFLKSELRPLLTARDKKRGWQPLIDKLNQAKGYNHLKRAGYSHIEFIPPSVISGKRTPDLSAYSGPTKVLCEVKTINISDDEAHRRYSGGVGSTEAQLDDGFFKKLRYDLIEAKDQMYAYDPNPGIERIAYVIVNYDDFLHEAADLYKVQIGDYVKRSNPVPDLEVVFDIKSIF
jgi:hypothetical protein